MGRVAVLLGLLFAAGLTLRGRLADPQPIPRETTPQSNASLAGMIVLLGVSMLVMAFAMFVRRPRVTASAPFEISDGFRGGEGRWNPRLLLLGAALVAAWLVIFVVLSQFHLTVDGQDLPTAPEVADPGSQAQPAPAPPARRKEGGNTYRVLVASTAVLVVLMVVATIVAGVRNRSAGPAVLPTGRPDDTAAASATELAEAAERGLTEVLNRRLEPREAIIACYAAMEEALAGTPGAAPQESDTPSEVLARAVGTRNISAGSAADLVEVFAEARFSRHVMTEGHREVAERALRSVLDELRSRA